MGNESFFPFTCGRRRGRSTPPPPPSGSTCRPRKTRTCEKGKEKTHSIQEKMYVKSIEVGEFLKAHLVAWSPPPPPTCRASRALAATGRRSRGRRERKCYGKNSKGAGGVGWKCIHSQLVTHIGHAESCQKLQIKILKIVPHLLLAAASTSLAASLTTEAAEAAGAAEPPKRLEKEMDNCRSYFFKHSNIFCSPHRAASAAAPS